MSNRPIETIKSMSYQQMSPQAQTESSHIAWGDMYTEQHTESQTTNHKRRSYSDSDLMLPAYQKNSYET